MASIETTNKQHGKHKHRYNKLPVSVDMTPMVDLAFLLLTFFVLTSVFTQFKSMEYTESDDSGEPTKIKNGITFLLGNNNRPFCYEGEFKTGESGAAATKLTELSFDKNALNSLHKYLLLKNAAMLRKLENLIAQKNAGRLTEQEFQQQASTVRRSPDAFTYLIKPNEQAVYADVVAVLNALNIHLSGKYFVQEIAPSENTLLKENTGSANVRSGYSLR